MLFDGTNQRSVVILDNAFIHHCDGIVELIESTGAIVIFLPPYSPDHRGGQEFQSEQISDCEEQTRTGLSVAYTTNSNM